MVRALRPWTLAAMLLVVAVGTAPPAAAEYTSTVCYGGVSDPSIQLNSARLTGLDVVTVVIHVSMTYFDMWEETNDKPGLQRTAKICTENTIGDDGVLISSYSWVETPADTPLAG